MNSYFISNNHKVMTQTIIWTIAILTVLGAALAVVLFVVAKKFHVEEDPRIDEVEKVLPGANCGGCGQAGCRAFAQHCVESSPNLDSCFCPVGGNEGMQKVAAVSALRSLSRNLRSLWSAATEHVKTVLVPTSTAAISLAVSRPLYTAVTQHVLSDVSDAETVFRSANSEQSPWIL